MKKSALAFLVVFAAMPLASATGMPPASQHHTQASASAALRQDMRRLWTDHVVWTRGYIVAAVGDQPDAQAAASRPNSRRSPTPRIVPFRVAMRYLLKSLRVAIEHCIRKQRQTRRTAKSFRETCSKCAST